MLIRKKRPGDGDIPSSEITPESVYLDRRQFMKAAGLAAAAGSILPTAAAAACSPGEAPDDKPNTYEEITTYNNFYEFGTDKSDPSRNAGDFKPEPWTVEVAGLCENPGKYALEDFLKGYDVVDRTYRHRCVEAWSMVIPWRGVHLTEVVQRLSPTPDARYIKFTTVMRPSEMPGQKIPVLPWPYVEGLRLDEATNELPLLVTGIYGKDLLNQNGAPLRLTVPWKYGFKSVKSIVKIEFTKDMPQNTWHVQTPNEYGFFANVNPKVDHPRWSQARERRIGEFRKRDTLMFNGYGEQVAPMYAGMDLRKWY